SEVALAVKLSPSGVPLWGETFGDDSVVSGVAVDASGNVILAGTFGGAISFGSTMLMGATTGGRIAFVAKLDPGGSPLWAKSSGPVESAEAAGVAIDASGNVVFTGDFEVSPIDFGCGPLQAVASAKAYVVQLLPDGTCSWNKAFSAPSGAYGTTVAV